MHKTKARKQAEETGTAVTRQVQFGIILQAFHSLIDLFILLDQSHAQKPINLVKISSNNQKGRNSILDAIALLQKEKIEFLAI